MEHQTISIIGGGIAGLTTAIALKKTGISAEVFEASNQIKPVGAGLGLGVNAMLAFKELGIYQDVIQQGRILPSFTIYDQYGKIITKTNFDHTSEIGNFTIHRAILHQVLLSKLEPSNIHLGKRVKTFETSDTGVKLIFEDDCTHLSNYLIVADGIHSVIRQNFIPAASPRYSGYTCWRAVINNHKLNINETSETWGSNGRFGMVPLANDSLYWFACINAIENDPAFKSYKVSDICNHFEKYHNPIPDILKHTENNDLIHNDIIDIEPLGQFAFGKIVLLGDAAHATTPNMGQGACQAIEDAVVIAQCMSRDDNFENAFRSFEKRRLKRTKWITDYSRSIGHIAQLENAFLIKIRNTAFRHLPDSFRTKQFKKIENVDFINSKKLDETIKTINVE